MLRRIFLQAPLSLFGLWPLLTRAKSQISPQHTKHLPTDIVIDQSGVLGNGVFVIGAFTASNPDNFVRATTKLRRRTKYRTTITHASRDKWKVSYASQLIDLWLATPGTRIDVLVVDSEKNQVKETPTDRLNRYVDLVGRLVDGAPNTTGVNRRLVTQRHYPKLQQFEFEKMLSARNSRVKSSLHIKERDSDILQLVDLVVGAIHASQPRKINQIENKSKLQMIAYLEKKLGSTPFKATLHEKRFSITHV